MMTTDRGPHGDTFSLKPTGWGRYIFDIPFLAVWLSFWLVFEVAVLVLLGGILAGVIGQALGFTVSFASRLSPDGSAPFFLLFLLVWLTMWTVGGLAAGTHFLRILAGRDVISVTPAGLELTWRAGPFRKRRTIAHGDIRRVRVNLQGDALVVDTATRTIDITKFGTREERAAILDSLKTRLVLPDDAQAKRLDAEAVPAEWEVEVEGTETRLFTPTLRTRRIVARILWGIAAMVIITGLLPSLSWEVEVTGAHLTAGGIGLLFAMWASWVTWGRSEWIVGSGQMKWRRRFGTWQQERSFENAALEIERTFDSDGDARFTLRVRNENARRKISTSLHESADLERLAEWLSARTRFPVN